MSFTAAIIGRPNVGKSTLFNRLVGQRLALVDDLPGVTRDRREGKARLGDIEFRVIDTAGLEDVRDQSLAGRMREQTERAIDDADVVLMVIDSRVGVTPMDRHFAELLRRRAVPVVLIANKSEGKAGLAGAYESFELGLGDPIAISAEHGEGLSDLFDALMPFADKVEELDPFGVPAPVRGDIDFDEDGSTDDPQKPIQLAIVGRPNVGKSTLINKLLGEERLLTGPEAGITRDSIAIEWEWRGRPIKLIDTAGLRRKSVIEHKLEKLSVADTLRAIRFAELVIMVVDATQMLEKQDLTIARMIEDEGRSIVLAINKWDLIENKPAALEKLRDRLQISLAQLQGILCVPVSGATGAGLDKLMKAGLDAHATWNRRIGTPKLNRWLAEIQERHPPPLVDGRRLRLRYMTQANTRPPTFALFSSKPGDLPDSYRRYLVNLMRETFDLPGTPIRVMLRKGSNPYADKD
ncbi:MAG TPA: ribosome biogenesis GTPase Der [Aliidongia sp.]|uniref:ribosome biogenesis GTPase Der n=1 Tax=Aliidongia sp. TaxID=1914230 RepID=UPI002DDCA1D6|nr:ribosome biogenesis GTPase Der [Aliidongia sp.]HEV2678654.1 ribosome biogenesis GTPase Der [Aliidongia sp.]